MIQSIRFIRNGSCRLCKQRGHTIDTCEKKEFIKKETAELANRLLTARYNSENIMEDTNITELYNILNSKSLITLCILNNQIDETIPKKNHIALYISNAIYLIYKYHREFLYHERLISPVRYNRIFCEKIYWYDISCGVPEDDAQFCFEEHLRINCCFILPTFHKFNITTVLILYRDSNTQSITGIKDEKLQNIIYNGWKYADNIPKIKDKIIECAICIEPRKYTESVTLNCRHEFCSDCFTHILKNVQMIFKFKKQPSCPLCRVEVNEISCVNPKILDAQIKRYCHSLPMVKTISLDNYNDSI
jgi:hypothetical protein